MIVPFAMCPRYTGGEPGWTVSCVACERLGGVEVARVGGAALPGPHWARFPVSWTWLLGLKNGGRSCGELDVMLGPCQDELCVASCLGRAPRAGSSWKWTGVEGLPRCIVCVGKLMISSKVVLVTQPLIISIVFDF